MVVVLIVLEGVWGILSVDAVPVILVIVVIALVVEVGVVSVLVVSLQYMLVWISSALYIHFFFFAAIYQDHKTRIHIKPHSDAKYELVLEFLSVLASSFPIQPIRLKSKSIVEFV